MKVSLFAAILLILTVFLAGGCQTSKPNPAMTKADPTMQSGGKLSGDDFGAKRNTGSDPGLENLDPSSLKVDHQIPEGMSARNPDFLNPANQIRGVLPKIYFDYDQSAIKASERPKLEQAAKYLKENPQEKLLLEGYCDWRGTAEYNLALGDRRASSVMQYLIQLGVASSRMQTNSKGDLEAKVDGTEKEMAEDRRVELVIVK